MSPVEHLPSLESGQPVAVLYQILPPPLLDGVRKPMKPGGYADSGADIVWALRQQGVPVLTPRTSPSVHSHLDWVFPEDEAGIAAARAQGARLLWANTVLFQGHPVERAMRDLWIVGQLPHLTGTFDDKWATNEALRRAGCQVAASLLVSTTPRAGAVALASLSEQELAARGLAFPLVLKPVRGRGSQGVVRVEDFPRLLQTAHGLFSSRLDGAPDIPLYGDTLILEQFLPGEELTLTVMPPGRYLLHGEELHRPHHWALPPVRRFNHHDGVAPYNGIVAVVNNSEALDAARQEAPPVQALLQDCARAASVVGARAPIRIDCRGNAQGQFLLFDLNMKPNLTGAGRPGREQQDSLVCLAARALGWSFGDLLVNMLRQAWRCPQG
jgi:D-alanine-D-alanine ligase